MSQSVIHWRTYPRGAALLALMHAVTLGVACPSVSSAAAGQAPANAAVARGERLVSLDFVQAEVPMVAKALSIQSGANVVLMPSVSGKVTVRLSKVPLERALKEVAVAAGADVRQVDSTYYVGSTVELKTLMARSGVKNTYTARYSQPADLKELLQYAFPYLTVETAGKSSLLVLTGSEEDVAAAVLRAGEADIAPPAPAVVEAVKPAVLRKFYGVKHANAAEVADALGKGMPEVKVSSVEKTLIVDGTTVQQASVAELLSTLDVEVRGERLIRAYKLKYLHPHQAAFTLRPLFPNLVVQAGFEPYSPPAATFKPLSLETEKAFSKEGLGGTQGTSGTSSATGGGSGGGGIGGGPQDLTGPGSRSRTVILSGTAAEVEQATRLLDAEDVTPQQVIIEARMVDISPEKLKSLGLEYDWSPLNFTEGGAARTFAGAFGRTPFNFSVALNALERTTDAKILSRPNISVVDGEEASIFIGDILRYERLSSVSDNGQQIFTIETVPVGVALLCRPRINGNRVTLKVHPTVSTIKDFGGRNNDIPITASREADTTVVLNDGDTFSIGGLLRDEDIKTVTKIPVLGDLPFIGNLFRSRLNRKNKSEVTIFLTVRIVDMK